MKLCLIAATLALILSLAQASDAAEISLSGFGTVGYAISDKEYSYQRFIDDNGTIRRDTVFGVQADVKFSERFSMILQGKFAPSDKDDKDWEPVLSWAFLSYRPTKRLAVQAGQAPCAAVSEQRKSGCGHHIQHGSSACGNVFAVSGQQFHRCFFSKTWSPDFGDILLDAYWGKTPFYWRVYIAG
ncbi:MAG: hypothetical protein HC887_05290 [Desulfobacteraceae bacterium]|nr:hypothetical protein [Desulfobacteraceae bacterium]